MHSPPLKSPPLLNVVYTKFIIINVNLIKCNLNLNSSPEFLGSTLLSSGTLSHKDGQYTDADDEY